METRNNVSSRCVIFIEYEEVGDKCLHKSEKQTKKPKDRFYNFNQVWSRENHSGKDTQSEYEILILDNSLFPSYIEIWKCPARWIPSWSPTILKGLG